MRQREVKRITMKNKIAAAVFVAAVGLLISGCDFDVPLTTKPTRSIDDHLIGDWVYLDVNTEKIEHMNVRKLDDFTYIVAYEGALYRAFHSDFADTAFLSVQDLNSAPGKYLYLVYQLSADGAKLGLKFINTKVIPKATKDQAAIQELIKQNLNNPMLFGEEALFSRKKAR
jgi:hypothetical protein